MQNKIEFLQQIKNTDTTFKVIKDCRAQHLASKGLEQRPNFKAGESAICLFNHLVAELMETNYNQFTMTNKVLAEIIGCTTTNLASRMKTFFREYGMGDFVSTGKLRYNIFKVVDKEGNEVETKINSEAHYTFYFSTEALDLMEAAGILTDVLDYNELRAQVPASKKLLEEIANKKTTNVYISQYLNDYVSIETRIKVEKDFLNKQGSYEKQLSVIAKDNNGEVVNSTEVESTSNTFVPKVKEEEVVEESTEMEMEMEEEFVADLEVEDTEMEMEEEFVAEVEEESIEPQPMEEAPVASEVEETKDVEYVNNQIKPVQHVRRSLDNRNYGKYDQFGNLRQPRGKIFTK